MGSYGSTCSLKLKYKKVLTPIYCRNEEKIDAGEANQVRQWDIRKFLKKTEDIAKDNDDLDTADYMKTEDSHMIPVIFRN